MRSSLVVLWLHFCCKLMKNFSQVDTVSPENIFKSFQKDVLHVLLWGRRREEFGAMLWFSWDSFWRAVRDAN